MEKQIKQQKQKQNKNKNKNKNKKKQKQKQNKTKQNKTKQKQNKENQNKTKQKQTNKRFLCFIEFASSSNAFVVKPTYRVEMANSKTGILMEGAYPNSVCIW